MTAICHRLWKEPRPLDSIIPNCTLPAAGTASSQDSPSTEKPGYRPQSPALKDGLSYYGGDGSTGFVFKGTTYSISPPLHLIPQSLDPVLDHYSARQSKVILSVKKKKKKLLSLYLY